MTDSVKGVSSSHGAAAGGNTGGGNLHRDAKRKPPPPRQDDLVEISSDARQRCTGKGKKNLLEYLKELFG